jgi:hypothetical protein
MSAMSSVVSTHVVESAVLEATSANVWQVLSSLDFKWWKLIATSELLRGGCSQALDATFKLGFKVYIVSNNMLL